ncbi:MAG: 23S rRNA (pseudouridine(1915)-N(3))-methyltransferase RlmH [Myxococcaceae bacterium]
MKVRVFFFGKDRSGLFEPAAQEYAKRLTHYAKFEWVALASSKSKVHAAEEEADTLFSKLGPREDLIALDERGQALGSVAFAQQLSSAQSRSRDLAFVIGGDEGLSNRVREQAYAVWALSALTMSHRLARLVLVEQLYRGFSILRGEPYAK